MRTRSGRGTVHSHRRRPSWPWCSAPLAMGISPILVRLADVGPFTSAFWRVALALPVLWAWMRVAERGPAAGGAPRVLLAADALCRPRLRAPTCSSGTCRSSTRRSPMRPSSPPSRRSGSWCSAGCCCGERVSRAVLAGLGALPARRRGARGAEPAAPRPDHVTGDLFGVATGVFFGLYFLAVRAARAQAGAARVTFETQRRRGRAAVRRRARASSTSSCRRSAQGWAALLASPGSAMRAARACCRSRSARCRRSSRPWSSSSRRSPRPCSPGRCWARPSRRAGGRGGLLIVAGISWPRPRGRPSRCEPMIVRDASFSCPARVANAR